MNNLRQELSGGLAYVFAGNVVALSGSCNDKGATRVRDYAKQRIKELGLAGKGRIRINQAGCLDRCEQGPVIVVYPEEVWYTYVDEQDVDEIIREHLQNGRVVERLRI